MKERCQLETKIWENAGKKLDFFQLCSAAKRVDYKATRQPSGPVKQPKQVDYKTPTENSRLKTTGK